MRYNIYTIFDSCAQVYQRPFVAQSDGEALRSFGDIAGDKEHPIGQHPEHYSIWRNGTFSGADGSIKSEEKECLAHAIDLLAEQDDNSQRELTLASNSYGGTK